MVTNEQAMTWKEGCFEYHQMYQYRTTTFGKSNRHGYVWVVVAGCTGCVVVDWCTGCVVWYSVYFLFGTACLVLLVLPPTVAVANLFVDDIVLFFISVHIAHQFAKHLSPNKTYEGYTSKILFEFALKSCVDESYKKKIQKGLDALPPSKSSKRSSSSSSSSR